MGKSKSKENGTAKIEKVKKAVEKATKKTSSAKVDKKENGSAKEDKKAKKEAKRLAELEALKKKQQEEEESDSESDTDSSASEDESETKADSESEANSSSDSESEADSSSDSDSDSDASTSDEPASKAKPGVTAASSEEVEDSSDSDSSDASSSDSSDDSDVEMNEDSDSGKRKADSDVEMDDTSDSEETKPEPVAKKQRTETETASIFVGNLPFSATEESLKDVFGEFGEVTGARIATQADSGRSRGFGYVDFNSSEARDKALAATHVEIEGRQLRMEKTDSGAQSGKPARTAQPPSNEPSKTLFVGNLSFHSNEEGIREAFAECGNVVSVRIVTDRDTGRPKGFGYIEFDSLEAAASAMEWNGSDLDGRNIRLDYSAPRPNNGGGARGGGRGGARGGRGRGGGNRFGNANRY
ncbi:RNA-binding domain-containing protein [Coemansia reversa NRRL 1564]|uniref:RNA-binding domain-containing protein n=1 Tax=Coemansia reversa (strain ATCC 12441 / NRRL 1564) TaxID=763665 RepID=A0A2G5B7N5_COERN|nr:RNA-binding domain-containing protein [Coemansia reversa NRRL 1564]|eukprot:PIA15028.1 RNA-binding domain-containing protein [Coemansia reversa NRRL 1564]